MHPFFVYENLVLDCLYCLRNWSNACEDEASGGLKRPPPPPPSEQDEEEERSKRRNVEQEDEDWLRYSPPPAPEIVVAEKTISRFASEIHGDSVPVTAPNGERVYAKLAMEGLVGRGISGTRQGAHFSNPNSNHKG